MTKYIGEQTKMALENFPFPLPKTDIDFYYAYTKIKKAVAVGNYKAGNISKKISEAIIKSCDEVLAGKHDDNFVTCSLQGGACTSVNMNVNEVLANRASEICGQEIHPNDHVNCSQSTNDTDGSALKILCLDLLAGVDDALSELVSALDEKAEKWKDIKKLGRTHIQDAVPITLGSEFGSYSATVSRGRDRLADLQKYMYDLSLGGTAVGNKINASEKYIEESYKALQKISGYEVYPADNLMSAIGGAGDFAHLTATLNVVAMDLSKIARDLRFMASGPLGGISEITLENLQPGSSIMPGKVNPVLAEAINQMYFYISGRNLTAHHAAEAANLELNVMIPILSDSAISSLKVFEAVVRKFTQKVVKSLAANPENCKKHLENSTAYATLLNPYLGYDTTSACVKKALKEGKTFKRVVLEKKLMSEEEFDERTGV